MVPPHVPKMSPSDSYWRKGYSFSPKTSAKCHQNPGLASSQCGFQQLSEGFTVTVLLAEMFPPTKTFGLYLLSLFITLSFPRIDKTFYSSASILSSLYLFLNHLPIKLELISLLIWHILKNAINLPFTLLFNIMNKVSETPHPTPVLGSSLFIIALC